MRQDEKKWERLRKALEKQGDPELLEDLRDLRALSEGMREVNKGLRAKKGGEEVFESYLKTFQKPFILVWP